MALFHLVVNCRELQARFGTYLGHRNRGLIRGPLSPPSHRNLWTWKIIEGFSIIRLLLLLAPQVVFSPGKRPCSNTCIHKTLDHGRKRYFTQLGILHVQLYIAINTLEPANYWLSRGLMIYLFGWSREGRLFFPEWLIRRAPSFFYRAGFLGGSRFCEKCLGRKNVEKIVTKIVSYLSSELKIVVIHI